MHVSLRLILTLLALLSLAGPAGAQPPPAKTTDDGKTFTLIRIEVTRRYQYTPPDKTAKLLKPGLEYVKEEPAEAAGIIGLQMSSTRKAYVSSGVLKVDAPPVVTDGQPVTIKATAHSAWEFKTDAGAELTQTIRVAGRDEVRETDATESRELTDTILEDDGELSVTLTLGEDLHVRKWEKDGVRYRSFAASLTNQHGKSSTESVEAIFIYRQGAMTADANDGIEGEATPVEPALVPAVTPPVTAPGSDGFAWWWWLVLLLILLALVAWKMSRKKAPAP